MADPDAPHQAASATAEVHRTFEDIRSEWEALWEERRTSPFVHPGWFEAWWSAFGKGQLEIVALRRDGELIAVAPMARRRGAVSSLCNWHTPAFTPVVRGDSGARSIADALASCEARRIELSFVPPSDPLATAWPEHGDAGGRRHLRRVIQRSPWIDLTGTWDEYLAALSSRRRSKLRRRRRRLEEQGTVELQVHEDTGPGGSLLDEVFAVEARSWKSDNGTAILSQPETAQFYRDVAVWAQDQGWLRLALLRLDGRPIAVDLAIELDGAHHLLKTGYDQEFRSLAPGVLLRAEMVRRSFEIGLERYEFLGGDAPYKRDWTDETRDLLLLQAFATSPTGRIDHLAHAYGRPAAKRVRDLLRARLGRSG